MTSEKTILFRQERNYRQCLVDAVKMVLKSPVSASVKLLVWAGVASIAWALVWALLLNDLMISTDAVFFIAVFIAVLLHSFYLSSSLFQIESYSSHNALPVSKAYSMKSLFEKAKWIFPLRLVEALLFVGSLVAVVLLDKPYITWPALLLVFLVAMVDHSFVVTFGISRQSPMEAWKLTLKRMLHDFSTSLLLFLCFLFALTFVAMVASIPVWVVALGQNTDAAAVRIGDVSTIPMWANIFQLVWMVVVVLLLYVTSTLFNWVVAFYAESQSIIEQQKKKHEDEQKNAERELKAINQPLL